MTHTHPSSFCRSFLAVLLVAATTLPFPATTAAGEAQDVPRLVEIVKTLVGCEISYIPFTLVSTRPLDLAVLSVRVDGQATGTFLQASEPVPGQVTSHLGARLPRPDASDATHSIVVDATLPTGDVVRLVDATVESLVRGWVSVWGPNGWTYNLRPMLGASSMCAADPIASVRVRIDGIEQPGGGWLYRFDHDLKFMETHDATLDVTLRSGATFHNAYHFIEGLDVLEFDVLGGGQLAFKPVGDAWVFGTTSPTLPPVSASVGSLDMRYLDTTRPLAVGAHARAVYAPRAIVCPQLGLCSPLGGDAPGFTYNIWYAELTLTSGGQTTWLPAAGQFAAASYLSHPTLPRL